MLRNLFIPLLSLLFLLSSCTEESEEPSPDVSNYVPQFKFERFDQELFAIDTNNVNTEIQTLQSKYPAFSSLYFDVILLLNRESRAEEIEGFLKDKRIQHLQDTTQTIIGSLDEVEADLYKSLQYYNHYFPSKTTPNFYTFISEYGYQCFLFDDNDGNDGVGIGLDLFLGSKYPYQHIIPNNPAFSAYLTRSFNKDHIAKKSMEALIEDIIGTTKGNTLLDNMIHNGKKIYILDKLLPFVSDTVIMEYTQKQLDWCHQNEIQMWGYLFSENLFYSTDIKKINKLINPSPHSSGMPTEAPGRTANYIGWQIIKSYMKKFPEKTLEDLLKEYNAQEILELSKYKPRNR